MYAHAAASATAARRAPRGSVEGACVAWLRTSTCQARAGSYASSIQRPRRIHCATQGSVGCGPWAIVAVPQGQARSRRRSAELPAWLAEPPARYRHEPCVRPKT